MGDFRAFRVTYTYNEKEFEFWISGDGKLSYALNVPVDHARQAMLQEKRDRAAQSKKGMGCAIALFIFFLIHTFVRIAQWMNPLFPIILAIAAGAWLYYIIDANKKILLAKKDLEDFEQEQKYVVQKFKHEKKPFNGVLAKLLNNDPNAF